MTNQISFECVKYKLKRFQNKKVNGIYDWYEFFQAYCISLSQLNKEPDWRLIKQANKLFRFRQMIIINAIRQIRNSGKKFYEKRDKELAIKNLYADKLNEIDSRLMLYEARFTKDIVEPFLSQSEQIEIQKMRKNKLSKNTLDISADFR